MNNALNELYKMNEESVISLFVAVNTVGLGTVVYIFVKL